MGITFLDIMDRAYQGEVCNVKDWELRICWPKIKEKLKEYDLEGLYTPENPISADDSLADEFFKAAWDVAVDLGFLYLETNRIIKIEENELKEYLSHLPSKITVGMGCDERTWIHRTPESKQPLGAYMGPCGNPITEKNYIPIHQAMAEWRELDAITVGDLLTAYGRDIRAGTPLETWAGYLEGRLLKQALIQAGRPGLFVGGGLLTQYGHMGYVNAPNSIESGQFSWYVLPVMPFKTCALLMNKVAHKQILTGLDKPVPTAYSAIQGGYSGPPEGTILEMLAGTLLSLVIHMANITSDNIRDGKTYSTVSRMSCWMHSICSAALSRNTHVVTAGLNGPPAGPGTLDAFLESAVAGIVVSVCGDTYVSGTKAAEGRAVDHTSPAESIMAHRVANACLGMKRKDANEILKKLIPKYENHINDYIPGKSFEEVYDVKTLKPRKQTVELFDTVHKTLEEQGIDIQPLF